MHSRHRGQIEIIRELVASSRPGVRITHLMHAGNLCYASVLDYIDLMLKSRLVEERFLGDRKMYFATEKGLEFLRVFDEAESLTLPEIDQPFVMR